MSPNHENAPDEEEDDYMSMIIEEPKQKETFSQKKRREQREVSFPLFSPLFFSPLICTPWSPGLTIFLLTHDPIFFVLSRPNPAEESPPKPNAPPKKPPDAMKPFQKVP